MSFSSLPTELVRQIIELSVPSTFHSTTYTERSSILRSLCLVSRLFRHIAQPLMFDILWSKSAANLDAALDTVEGKSWNGLLYMAAIEIAWKDQKMSHLRRLARNAFHLRTLVISLPISGNGECKILDLTVLELFPNLTILQLSDLAYDLTSPIVLPKLEQLEFDYWAAPTVDEMLDPAVLPSLRSLAIVDMYGIEGEPGLPLLSRPQMAQLIPQLDAHSLNTEFVRFAPDHLVKAFDRTLFDYYHDPDQEEDEPFTFTQFRDGIQQLRLCDSDDDLFTKDLDCFCALTKDIRDQNPVRLRSLYLDASLQNAGWRHVRTLVQVCEEKGVEVIFEEHAKKSSDIDLQLSKEFCRRQKERRRLELER